MIQEWNVAERNTYVAVQLGFSFPRSRKNGNKEKATARAQHTLIPCALRCILLDQTLTARILCITFGSSGEHSYLSVRLVFFMH